MGHHIYWENDKQPQRLCIVFTGIVDWGEYDQAITELYEAAKAHPDPLYILFLPQTQPPKGNPIPHFRRGLTLFNELPQVRLAITVDKGTTPFFSRLIEMIARVYSPHWQNKVPYLRTMEEAEKMIEKDKEKIAQSAF